MAVGILIDAHSTSTSRIALIIKKADEDIHQLFFLVFTTVVCFSCRSISRLRRRIAF